MKFNYIGVSEKALVTGTIAEATTVEFVEAGAGASKGKKNRKRK